MQDLNTAAVKFQPSLYILGSYKTLAFPPSFQFTHIYIDYTHTYSISERVKLWPCLMKIAHFRCHLPFFSYVNVRCADGWLLSVLIISQGICLIH